jgi:hypothetical protein
MVLYRIWPLHYRETPSPSSRGGWLGSRCRSGPSPLPELLQDTTNQNKDGNTQCTLGEPGADILSQSSDNDGERECGENKSELEKDMLLAFKEQEDLSLAHSPNSVHRQHLSPKPAQPEISQEPDQSGSSRASLEEPGHGSPLRPEKAEGNATLLEQQPQERVADEVEEAKDGSCRPEQDEQGEKMPHQEVVEEASSNMQPSESSLLPSQYK